MIDEDIKLNKILAERSIPPPTKNLVYRITKSAQIKHKNISWQEELLKLLVILKPVYITACCLCFGLAIGVYTGLTSEASTQDWFDFLQMQEEGWI